MVKLIAKDILVKFIVAIVVLIILSLVFLNSMQKQEEINVEVGQYSQSSFDYAIKNPSYEQVDELENMSNVNDIAALYSIYVEDCSLLKSVTVNLFADRDSLQITNFNESRVIKSIDYDQDNSVYITNSFAKENSLDLGDKIKVTLGKESNLYEFIITAIVIDTNFPTSQDFLVGVWSQAIEDCFTQDFITQSLYYSLVYIDIDESQDFYWLDSYIPMGSAPIRDNYWDDEGYEKALEEYIEYNSSYVAFNKSEEVENLSVYYSAQQTELNKALYLGTISFLFIILLGIIISIRSFKSKQILMFNAKLNRFTAHAFINTIIACGLFVLLCFFFV